MAEEQKDEANPIDQLVDLFVYAPVGLLYEYPNVLPKLIKRGKSQVQLARVVGQLAVKRGNASVSADDVAGVAATLVGRAVTEIGAAIGLAPDEDDDTPPPPQAPAPPPPPAPAEAAPAVAEEPPEAPVEEKKPAPLPIANYDDLKAREIIPLLDSLSASQRDTIRAHEEAGRSRKTVLGKLDRLES